MKFRFIFMIHNYKIGLDFIPGHHSSAVEGRMEVRQNFQRSLMTRIWQPRLMVISIHSLNTKKVKIIALH